MKRFLRLLAVGIIALFLRPADTFGPGLPGRMADLSARYARAFAELTDHIRHGSLDPSMLYRILPHDIH